MNYILYLSILLFICANGEYEFRFDGGSLVEPLYDHWTFMYSVLDKSATVSFETIPQTSTRFEELLDNPSDTDVVSASGTVNQTVTQMNNIVSIPIVSFGIVPAYNLPTLAYKDGRSDIPTLNLQMQTLAKIFTRNITAWNDPQIVNDNPDILLPATNITVVLRSDNVGATTVFMSALNKSVANWPFDGAVYWPASVLNSPDYFPVKGDNGMSSVIQNIPNTIGYLSLGILLDQNSFVTTYATLTNSNGQITDATAPNVTAEIENSGNGWPISTLNRLYFRNDTTDFSRQRSLLKFIYWALTNTIPQSEVIELGYAPLPSSLHQLAINTLLNVKCNNKFVLETEVQPMHTSGAFLGFIVTSIILLGISIVLLVLWFIYHPTVRKNFSIIFYQGLQFSGITVLYISITFWYFIPSETWVCTSRLWFTNIGFTLLIGAMFERTWRIQRVYGLVEKGNQLTGKLISMMEVGGGIAAIVTIQIIILAIWTGVDPYEKVGFMVNDFEIRWICDSKYGNLWLSLEAVYFGMLLIWGVYVVYSSWNLKNVITESRWILASLYNNLLLLVLLLAILQNIEKKDEVLVYFVAPLILLANTNVVVAVYVPTVLRKVKIIRSTSDKKSETSEMTHTVTTDV